MKPIRKLAFVVNEDKSGALELAHTLMTVAKQSGVKLKQTTRFPVARGFLRGVDACCVIGGDGTLLGVAREAVREQVLQDPHSPDRFRVNGVVVNQPGFAPAFGCKQGAPMVPVKSCRIW